MELAKVSNTSTKDVTSVKTGVRKRETRKSSIALKDQHQESATRSENSYKYLDTYQDLLTLRQVPVSEVFLERLGTDLVKWARGEGEKGPIKLTPFFIELGIGESTYYRWSEKHPTFKAQIELAKRIIGNRREEAAFWRKGDASIFLKSAPIYDPEFKELEEWRSKLSKKDGSEDDHNITIVMERFTSDGEKVREAVSESHPTATLL